MDKIIVELTLFFAWLDSETNLFIVKKTRITYSWIQNWYKLPSEPMWHLFCQINQILFAHCFTEENNPNYQPFG